MPAPVDALEYIPKQELPVATKHPTPTVTEKPQKVLPDKHKLEQATPSRVPKEEVVTKIEKPQVLEKLKNIDVPIGGEARLECKVDAQPPVTVEWYRDRVPVEGDRYTSVLERDGTCILIINPVEEDDDTEFECRVINPGGMVTSIAEVYVIEQPSERTHVEVHRKKPFKEVELVISDSEEVSKRTDIFIEKHRQPLQPIEFVVDVGDKPQETVQEVVRTVTETVTTVVETEEEEIPAVRETMEVSIERATRPEYAELVMPEEEEYQPEFEVLLMPEEVSEDEVSEQTSITIERKPEQRQPVELIIETRKKPEETQTEVVRTVTETVTTVVETDKEEIPETRETMEVSIERETIPQKPVEIILDVQQRGPAEISEAQPEYAELVMPDEEYQPEFEVIVMPEEVSEDEVSEQTSITIERKPEQRQPVELIIETRKEPEETQTEVVRTVTETVTTVVETDKEEIPETRETMEVSIERETIPQKPVEIILDVQQRGPAEISEAQPGICRVGYARRGISA